MRLTPRNTAFYDLFATSASTLVKGARLLSELLAADTTMRVVIADQMRAAEHEADDITHELMRTVNSSFITPFA